MWKFAEVYMVGGKLPHHTNFYKMSLLWEALSSLVLNKYTVAFKLGTFTNFTTLLSVVSTDFPKPFYVKNVEGSILK